MQTLECRVRGMGEHLPPSRLVDALHGVTPAWHCPACPADARGIIQRSVGFHLVQCLVSISNLRNSSYVEPPEGPDICATFCEPPGPPGAAGTLVRNFTGGLDDQEYVATFFFSFLMR